MYGAGNEIRTRDLNLGKVALYQLSYSRVKGCALWGMALFVSTGGRCKPTGVKYEINLTDLQFIHRSLKL